MRKNILITGEPRSGKSTLLRQLISSIPNKAGFVTNEIVDNGERVGFETETHLGNKEVVAHVDYRTPYQVSKYFVDPSRFEPLLEEVRVFGPSDVLYIDEIGPMQLFSPVFKDFVRTYFDSPNTCVAVIKLLNVDPFIEEIKARKDIVLVELTSENREEKNKFISAFLGKIEKARRYLAEPERFAMTKVGIVVRSEHGLRNLSFENGRWSCSCEFNQQYQICSHALAVEEFVRINKQ